MKTTGENIKTLRESRGMTQLQLANLMGMKTYTTISKWESDDNFPKGKDLIKLSKLFNVSVDSILGINDDLNYMKKTFSYHYMPTAISAGLPIEVDGITETEKISIPDSLMGKWAGNKDIFITKICGDSMDKDMSDGSLIAVKPTPLENLKDGDMVVFRYNYDYSVKYFYNRDDELVFKPNSYNKDHDEQRYKPTDNIEIIGKVVMHTVIHD